MRGSRTVRSPFDAVALVVLLMSLVLAPAIASAQTEDITPAQIAALSFGPDPIDVFAGDQTVVVTERLTDDLSGVWFSCFSFRSPSGQSRGGCNTYPYTLVSGTTADGIYSYGVVFPQFSEAGTWHLETAYVYDNVSNVRFYSESELVDLGVDTTLEVIGPASDITAAQIADFSVTPSVIDASASDVSITVTERLTDNASGAWFSCFTFSSPSGQTRGACNTHPYTLISGTTLDGIYGTTVLFPRYSEAGTWHLASAYVYDNVGNVRFYTVQELADAGFDTSVDVVAEPDDTTPAVVANLSFSPTTIQASEGDVDVALTEQLTDDLSGVWFSCFTFRSPSGQQSQGGCNTYPYTLVVGDGLDGVYTYQVRFPQFSEEGDWHLETAYVYDNVGNVWFYSEQQLIDLGFNTVLTVVVDTTPPMLTVTLDPSSVWAPNHKLFDVNATIVVHDDGDPSPTIELVSITSNEPDNGQGDGDTPNDIQDAALGTDDRSFRLRAERSGGGSGRVYTVTYAATDRHGNRSTATATVVISQ